MHATSTRSQLSLRWVADDELRWDELLPAMQAELRELRRGLLVAASDERLEAGHDQ